MIEYILLGFLNYQPMTGYDLKQSIDQSTVHFWHAHHSQIYTTLRQMEAEGLVTSQFVYAEGQPNRRVYTITAAGQQKLRAWLDQPMLEMTPVKEDFLVRIFFSGQREPAKVLAELNLQLELHQQKLEVYHRIQHDDQFKPIDPKLNPDVAFWHSTLDMGILYEEAYLAWLKNTIAVVEKML